MGHYRSNLRDIEFNLFEVFHAEKHMGVGPFAEMDADTARNILAEVEHVASGDLADSYAEADRNPPIFDASTHSATLPEAFKKSYRRLLDGEWYRLSLSPELGGYGAPLSLNWACGEMLAGSNAAAYIYMACGTFPEILYRLGTPEQRKLAQQAVENQWGATMVLTEPDAGSDVGAGVTKAVERPDGSWRIDGVKRFITSGEHDLAENIIHFVLARPEGAGPGTKGLSMFIVPKFLVNDDGTLGERNSVNATNVEHKMGLKGSTTCELTFDSATGYLVGGVHDGIAQMFKIIEFARMLVGTKAIATLSTGYLNALDYAKTRVQGADLTQMTDKTAPRVTITHHPDVRRSLMRQKAYAEGLRSLVLFTATIQDQIALAEAAEQDATELHRLNDLLLPLVKGCGSERSYELLGSESLQTFGGSGYLQDYPIEQYIRDAKIDTLYEGTTAIQGLDLFFRKIVRDKGVALQNLSALIAETLENNDERLSATTAAVAKAAGDVQAMIATMTSWLGKEPKEIYKVGLNTSRLLLSLGDVVVGWLLLRGAQVALSALDANTSDKNFYQGKVAAAQFYAATVLPEITSRRKVCEATTMDLMELPEEAF